MRCGLLKNFGTSVRLLRETRQWSQEQLAEYADLNRSYVGEIERGQVVVSILTIGKLANAFDMSGARLLEQCDAACREQVVKDIKLVAIAC